MDSSQNALEKNNEDKANISVDKTSKYFSRTIRKDGLEQEIDLDKIKRVHRNTVYSQRTAMFPFSPAFNPLSSDNMQKKQLFILSKYEIILQESAKTNKKLEENNKEIEELNNNLKKLKEEKKKKQNDLLNYLSNKESLEEIYINKISYLINHKNQEKSKIEDKDFNLNSDSLKGPSSEDSLLFDIDEEKEIEIKIEEIKKSDKNKFTEQTINLAEELLQKKGNEDLINKIKSKIKIAYNIFFSEISTNSPVNSESIISNFFSRIGLYISNQSYGLYSEVNINKFLRYLIKINSINIETTGILKFLNKKYKESKMEMKSKINDLKKKNENLKDKKNINEKNIEKYENLIKNNKEYLQNLKENNNNNLEGKNEKRRYTTHTLGRLYFGKGNNLKVLPEEISNIPEKQINTEIGNEKEKEKDNLPNITLKNKNPIKNENTNEPKINNKKPPKSKSKDKEDKSKDNIKNKNDSNKNDDKKTIFITKNTRIVLKKTAKQYKINNFNKQKDNQSNDNNTESKTLNSYSNLNNFDDSNNVDSELNSKHLNNSNSINQNYIVIKNNIDIKDKNQSNTNSNNNNKYPNNIKRERIRVIKPITSDNNYLIKKYNIGKREKTQNNIPDKNKNKEENDKNLPSSKKNSIHPKAKFNKNIYIINNINNSEQIKTKNNIYGNKSNNLNINSVGNLNYDNYNENYNKTDRNINYNTINNNSNNKIQLINSRNRTFVKINNNYKNTNNNQGKEIKNKTNYNFRDILQVNTGKNNKSYLISNSNNSHHNNTMKKETQVFSSILPNKNSENTTPKTIQRNSHDYKYVINKRHNINNNSNLYNNNNLKSPDNKNASNGINNQNNSYKISIYSRRKETNEGKK